MIARMHKVTLVVLDRHRREALERLRRLGVVHVERGPATAAAPAGEELSALRERRAGLERAVQLLPLTKQGPAGGRQTPKGSASRRLERALEVAAEIAALSETLHSQQEELDRLLREQERLAPWGEYDPAELRELEQRGVTLRLYELGAKQLEELPEDVGLFVLARGKSNVRVAAVALGGEPEVGFEPLALPERGLAELRRELSERQAGVEKAGRRLEELSAERALLAEGMRLLQRDIEFEEIRSGMAAEGPLCHLRGYVPQPRTEVLRRAAADEGWALLVEKPTPEDPVPTLIENPRWVQIVQPVFGLLGTVPGYREFDISFWFLLFFSLFFAMLIGDAGYGLIFLALTVIARLKMRKAPGGAFTLMFVLSSATVVWGALSGTWFGVEGLARHPLLGRLVIPAIATFAPDNAQSLMLLCFVIGAVHLSIARLMSFFRNLPRINAFTDLGWLAILWGMFFVIRYIVLKLELHPVALPLVGGGLAVVVICAEQQGRFFKGLLMGVATLPLKVLNSISAFSDIVSYVRLFAVGLATVEVAKSFNTMAAGIGFALPAGLISALILFVGHALNIAMGALSVLVHGVRLNLLEFSSHLGMEWKGTPYNPFRETLSSESADEQQPAKRRKA